LAPPGLRIDTQKVKNKSIFDKSQKTKEKLDFDDTLVKIKEYAIDNNRYLKKYTVANTLKNLVSKLLK